MTTDEATQRDLFEKIDRSERAKYSVKIKTLMTTFGFDADHRVRQASLDRVVDQLDTWGIACSFPSASRSANDWVTLSRHGRPSGPPARPLGVISPTRPWTAADGGRLERRVDASMAPLNLGFRVGDAATDAESQYLADEILEHVWSFRPVCLVVEGEETDFAFAGAVLGAVMRRRVLFVPNNGGARCPSVPEVVSAALLERVVGRPDPREGVTYTQEPGTVLLMRAERDDPRGDAVVALARDVLVPHTYRLRARPDAPLGPGEVTALAAWVAAFAGAPALAAGLADKLATRLAGSGGEAVRTRFDLAAILTEAVQVRDSLISRACERGLDREFRASNESTEHMVLKASAWRYLTRIHGAASVRVEETYDAGESGELDEEDAPDGPLSPPPLAARARKCRPDLRVEGKRWVEIETLRGRAKSLRDPFFELERRMLKPVEQGAGGEEILLLVPSDLAMLASRRMDVIVRNLRRLRSDVTVEWGFVDVESDEIVLVDVPKREPPPIVLAGSSWRQPPSNKATPLRWNAVAGYEDVKRRLREDVLDPLRDPAKYRRHGLTSSSGLLLYGLPGCGKSFLGRVLAAEAGIACKVLLPSDLTSHWLGAGVGKIREAFDWALEQEEGCLLVLDEIDGVGAVRSEVNMHSDEKRQVNELLVQLDRVHLSKKPVIVVGTTNYIRGIDGAVRRSGRFDVKIPVFPPDRDDRKALFSHFVTALVDFDVSDAVDALDSLAGKTPLFAPADIESVVSLAAKRAVFAAKEDAKPRLTAVALRGIVEEHQRSITRTAAEDWVREARTELGAREGAKLAAVERDIALAYPT